jgi:hypothetical protein
MAKAKTVMGIGDVSDGDVSDVDWRGRGIPRLSQEALPSPSNGEISLTHLATEAGCTLCVEPRKRFSHFWGRCSGGRRNRQTHRGTCGSGRNGCLCHSHYHVSPAGGGEGAGPRGVTHPLYPGLRPCPVPGSAPITTHGEQGQVFLRVVAGGSGAAAPYRSAPRRPLLNQLPMLSRNSQ